VVFIHPLHNLAVVSYDPKSIGSTPVRTATLISRPLSPGDDVWVVGERADSKIQSQKTQISSVDVVSFPLSRTLRFRDSNLEAVSLINPPTDYDGVLTDDKGDVVALWSSFAFESQRELEQINRGIPADLVGEMIGVVADGRPLYSFEAEFNVQSLAGARELGLPDEWVRRFEEHNPQRRQVLGIDRLVAGSPAAALLEPGDLLLAIDGKVVNRFREVERAVQNPAIKLSVWRDGAEKTLQMKTVPLDGRDLDRVLIWGPPGRDAARGALARVGLDHRMTHKPQQLSGGERQRVAIARAVVGDRRLLLADEPSGALDSVNGEAVMRLMHAACKRGVAAVVVTHDAQLASWADRVVFLRDGRVVDQTVPPAGPESLLIPGEST